MTNKSNLKKFKFYRQPNVSDCGPTCLKMISGYYGKRFNYDTLRNYAGFGKQGVSLLGISESAEKIGFRTRGAMLTYKQLTTQAPLPCILHWSQNHFVVLLAWKKRFNREKIKIADPAKGIISLNPQQFIESWASNRTEANEYVGAALLLEPTASFYEQPGDKTKSLNWFRVLQNLKKTKWQLGQILLALLITSILQLIAPFLTQTIVDNGISMQNVQYVTVVLMAQFMLIVSRNLVEFIRSRLLLHISTSLNLSILSDFWIKLTKLPISYFDRHQTGDTIQRIGDHRQIQTFLTGSALTTFFSLFNFIVFSIILISYSPILFAIFLIGSILYFLWVRFFLKIKRRLNYQNFYLSSKENNITLQLVQGMQEIKLNNAEQIKRWEWERIQSTIFKLGFKNLNYSQIQQVGATIISQGKDILITLFVANLVIKGNLTLGAMLAVQYIIGQLSSPIEQFVGFVQAAQDAKISMERLNEIHDLKDEENAEQSYIQLLPDNHSIFLKDVSFSYSGIMDELVLKNINLEIPQGKVTAIVGLSGSGKTTLLKLLLKFYDNYTGDIKIGDNGQPITPEHGSVNFRHISPAFWRRSCGAVLQDGYLFDDTIARNIAVGDETINFSLLLYSCKVANILTFVESLPNGFYTKLGPEGTNLSQGQKQRILIARAVYKKPQYLFLDEATNALDANNERAIVENLHTYFQGKTVVVVAHRLSTVKNADKIIVLEGGEIVEQGNHVSLSNRKGKYFELVKNQLEVGG